ncbi:zinc finger, CCHC-type containing protein [Tanacetum coccineum]
MQNKMHFLISTISVVYVSNTPILNDGDDATVKQIRRRNKWDNDDYVCRGILLNYMSDSLFDIYQNVESRKELLDSLEAKYMAKDALSKKFIVSNFTNYKMTNSRPAIEQYSELLGILGRFTQHKMNLDEVIQISCIIDKKEELTLVELGRHLRIKESLRVHDSDNPKSNNVDGPSVVNMLNIVNDNIGSAFMSTSKLNDSIIWHARLGHVHFKRMQDMSQDGDLCDLHATLSLGNKKYFLTFIDDDSRTESRVLCIEPNESVSIISIIETRDAYLMKISRTEDVGGSTVLEKVTEEVVVQQPEPELKKQKE